MKDKQKFFYPVILKSNEREEKDVNFVSALFFLIAKLTYARVDWIIPVRYI
jgi:hypothetical protein